MRSKQRIARWWQSILASLIVLSAATGMWLTTVAAEDLLQSLGEYHADVCRDSAPLVTDPFCALDVQKVQFERPDREALWVNVLVADSSDGRAAGYQFIHPDVMARSAILFVFERESTGAFHMCNVAAPIDIVWFRPDGRVLDVRHMEPGPARPPALCRQLYAPATFGTYQYALELPSGFVERAGLRVDDIKRWRLRVDPLFSDERQTVAAQPVPNIRLTEVVSGLTQPVGVTYAPGDQERLFVVEKVGRIRVVKDGRLEEAPLLDVGSSVSRGSEQGLLSVAFHPRFQENGFMFINLTNRAGNTEVVRYTVNPRTYRVDPESRAELLSIDQPAANHNGGMMAFGPDGYLYIGTGDGGRAGDPWGNAQNLGTLLGKMLRIDVDGTDGYTVPSENPFLSRSRARGEIWAYGLRNPWRFSFDRQRGDLYIADVGQRDWEEVNAQSRESLGGENYGWNIMEGRHCYPGNRACDPQGLTLPIHEYGHRETGGCSVTGGYVYRGREVPALNGWYVFGDYCNGRIWALDVREPGAGIEPRHIELLQTSMRISSFGEDALGELFVTDLSSGTLYKVQHH